jgi:hypothetical protein
MGSCASSPIAGALRDPEAAGSDESFSSEDWDRLGAGTLADVDPLEEIGCGTLWMAYYSSFGDFSRLFGFVWAVLGYAWTAWLLPLRVLLLNPLCLPQVDLDLDYLLPMPTGMSADESYEFYTNTLLSVRGKPDAYADVRTKVFAKPLGEQNDTFMVMESYAPRLGRVFLRLPPQALVLKLGRLRSDKGPLGPKVHVYSFPLWAPHFFVGKAIVFFEPEGARLRARVRCLWLLRPLYRFVCEIVFRPYIEQLEAAADLHAGGELGREIAE